MMVMMMMTDHGHLDQGGGEARDDNGDGDDDHAHLDQGGGEVGGRFLSQCLPSASPENVGI